MKENRLFATQRFVGARFGDHLLDLDALPELISYKKLISALASELWRRENPSRHRLPRGFEDSIVLKLGEIREGSVEIPLYREVEVNPDPELFAEHDEVDEAAVLLNSAIACAVRDEPPPSSFPKSMIPSLRDHGSSLRAGEAIEYRIPEDTAVARFDLVVKERIGRWAEGEYDDTLDRTLPVVMVNVEKHRMAVRLDDGRLVEAPFTPTQEEILTTALKEHTHARVHLEGRGRFDAEGTLTKITMVDSLELLPQGAIEYDDTVEPIWKVFQRVAEQIPDEELAKLPKDGSEHHDRYLYGE